jgi:hypothetical protein
VFRQNIQINLGRFNNVVNSHYDSTVETWKVRPQFSQKTDFNFDVEMSVTTFTQNRIYYFLHEGTAVRYATMTDPFWAKTVPGFLGSREGKGRKLFVNRSVPRPGIEARKWTDLIIKKRTKLFEQLMGKAIIDGIHQSGHSF